MYSLKVIAITDGIWDEFTPGSAGGVIKVCSIFW